MKQPEMCPSEYISMYASPSTRQVKYQGIKKYLEVHLGRELSNDGLDGAMLEYISSFSQSAVANHLIHFFNHPSVMNLSPASKQSYLSATEQYFCDCCGFHLTGLQRKFRRRAMTEKVVAISQEYNPTRDMIRDVLSLCDVRLRAQVLMCTSGGFRISELLHLRLGDIYIDETPVRIEIPAAITKNKLPRRTFISAEAASALRAYFLIRDETLARLRINSARVYHDHMPDESRVFPHTKSFEENRLKKVVMNSPHCGVDERTGRQMLHFHTFRKFFLTQAKKQASPDFVEAWAGHSGYLSAAYHRPSLEEEREEYLKCEFDLTINIPDDYLRLKLEHQTEIEQLREVSLAQQEMLSRLQDELRMLRNEKQTSPALVIPTSLD